MRITVCDFPDEAARAPTAWDALAAHLAAAPADVLVLPEMPFHDWAIFTERRFDEAAWNATVARHEAMVAELGRRWMRVSCSPRGPASSTDGA